MLTVFPEDSVRRLECGAAIRLFYICFVCGLHVHLHVRYLLRVRTTMKYDRPASQR